MKQTISIILIVAIVVVINLISQQFFFRLDLTEDKQYTLSEATKNVLNELENPVTITAYFSQNLPSNVAKNKQDFKDMLTEYATRSGGMLDYRFESPNEDEELEQKVLQMGIQPVMINVRDKDQMKQQKAYMGAVVILGDAEEIIPFIQPGAAMEYALTTSIKKLAVQDKPSIGIIQGHGEPTIQELGQAVQSMSILYEVESLDLNTTPTIPERIKTIAMIRPTDSIPASHFQALDQFLARGGKLFAAINTVKGDFQTAQGSSIATGFESWLSQKGILVKPEFVIDARCGTVSVQQRQGFFTMNTPVQFPYLPLISEFKEHPITKGLEEVMLEFASPIEHTGNGEFETILTTSSRSGTASVPLTFDVANKNWTQADFPMSNIPVGAILSNFNDSPEALIVAISDGDFAVSGQNGRSKDNISLLVNSIDWLSDDTGLIDLRTKGVATRPIEELDDDERSRIKWTNFLLPLLLVIALGIVRSQWNRRKRKARMQTIIQ